MPVSKGNEEREALERAYRLAMQKETEDEEKVVLSDKLERIGKHFSERTTKT